MRKTQIEIRTRAANIENQVVDQVVDAQQALAMIQARVEGLSAGPASAHLLLARSLKGREASLTTKEEEQQLATLYSGLRTPLGTYLSSIGLPADRADDVIQESFVRLLRHQQNTAAASVTPIGKRPAAGRTENLRGWLFRVAHNLAMDAHRDHDRLSERLRDENDDELPVLEFTDPANDPEQGLLYQERMSRLRRAVSRLTPQQRTCVLLRAQGKRYREIAVFLGISTQRAANLLQRGKLRLAGEL